MANIKSAIIKAKLEGILYELMVKTKAENIEFTTAEGTSTTVAAQLAAVIAECATKPTTDAMNKAIGDLKQEMLGDTPVEAYNTFTELAKYIETHGEVADALTQAIGTKADKSTVEGIQQTLAGLGSLATKSQVSESDLDSALATKVNAAAEGNHSHTNKALLDTYKQTEADLADAVAKKHEHANKDELDKIVDGDKAKWDTAAGKAHEHSNKELLDTYDQTNANIKDAVDKKHSHANADVLNGISQDDVDEWNRIKVHVASEVPAEMKDGDVLFQLVD